MLKSTTFKFLKELKKNNNRPWFDNNRNQYEIAKSDFQYLVESILAAIAEFDAPFCNLTAKECMFRINRDVRFSKDKSPYKNNMAAYFNKGGKKSNGAGYYLHVEPGKSIAAGGMWMPLPLDLAKIRQEIDYSFTNWKNIISNNSFKKMFAEGIISNETLIRPPKGYDENNPAIEYLKMKTFIITRPFTDTEVLDKGFKNNVTKFFKTMKPLIDFLNTAID